MFTVMKIPNTEIIMRLIRFIVCIACFGAGQVQASLMITPTRVVMDERHRTAEVTLLNTTTSTKVYRILWQELRQTESGGYVEIETLADDNPIASKMIQYSPRKVTIEPGKYQRIKLRLRLKGDLADGEYRSQLMMKVTDVGVDPESLESEVDGAHLFIIPKLSFSIPVMVRKGTNDSTTEITSVDLNTQNVDEAKMLVDVSHAGDFSSFGNIYVYMKPAAGGQVEKIGQVHNVALFRETKKRTVIVPLTVTQVPTGAVIQVVYSGEEEYEGQQLGTAAFTYKP